MHVRHELRHRGRAENRRPAPRLERDGERHDGIYARFEVPYFFGGRHESGAVWGLFPPLYPAIRPFQKPLPMPDPPGKPTYCRLSPPSFNRLLIEGS